jgi:hypothetical protein
MIQPTRTTITCSGLAPLSYCARVVLPVFVLVALAGPHALRAQEVKLPKAEAILDKYVEVTGGMAAYKKLNNRVTKGSFEIVGQGLTFSLVIHSAGPDKLHTVLQSDQLGKIEKGTDGKVAWEINVMTGPQIKEGDERAVVLRSAAFDGVPQWRRLFNKAECVGVETIEGKPAYKIILTPNEGPPETRYYDKESNLLVKVEISLTLPMGTIAMEFYPSDYKRVDGVLFPHKTRMMVLGTERIMTIESIEHNVEIPKDCFKLPAEIQELVDREKEGKAKPAVP